MGVISPYKTFTFDGESSADYGVYLTGDGVFNAPERSVEMVEIPGRNGNFALDKGRFENISVTYRVGMFDDDEENFADKVSAFRNWLCSKVGYVRLSDDYNPNEYRMAVYMSGVELEHDFLIAGEAEITFDCKPQRWLTSGEKAVSVADGGTLDNPTLFPSSPLLAVYGYGDISIGGEVVTIDDRVFGETIVANQTLFKLTLPYKSLTINLYEVPMLNGDNIIIGDNGLSIGALANEWECTNGTITSASASAISANINHVSANVISSTMAGVSLSVKPLTFNYGTAKTETAQVSVTVVGTSIGTTNRTITISAAYDGAYTITVTYTETSVSGLYPLGYGGANVYKITAYSSASALGNPMYIDLDIGECWNEDSGTPITINNAVVLPSDLPTLPSGSTTINYDNTITSLEVTPRWWKV